MKKKQKAKKKHPNRVGNPANLSPGYHHGHPPTIIPAAWDKFCIEYKLCGKMTQAAIRAGFHPSYGRLLLKIPRVQERLKLVDAAQLEKAIEDARQEHVLGEELLDENLVRVIKSVSHERRGLADVVAAIRHGNEVIGRVSGNRTTINNSANASASAVGTNAFQVYEADWLREKKRDFDRQLELKHGTESSETYAD